MINIITPLDVKFNHAHFDSSFAWIDHKIMKLRPIDVTYPVIWKLH